VPRLVPNPELPEQSQIVVIHAAARALHVNRQTLFRKMKEHGLPVVRMSARSRGLRLSDLNRLIDAHLKPAA
jgi:hypothetical protein